MIGNDRDPRSQRALKTEKQARGDRRYCCRNEVSVYVARYNAGISLQP